MDDHTFFLVRQADEHIRRMALLIEQHRLHMMALDPVRRRREETQLKWLIGDYNRLLTYRQALVTEPSYALMN